VEHELDDPGTVPQVDEDQPAVVTSPVHPTGHTRERIFASGCELAAP
jgi:hypothetical protein